jgi:small subunit ribosomal protein S6
MFRWKEHGAEKFKNYLAEAKREIVNGRAGALRKLAYPIEKKSTGFYACWSLMQTPNSNQGFLRFNSRRDPEKCPFVFTQLIGQIRQQTYAAKRRSLKSKKEN